MPESPSPSSFAGETTSPSRRLTRTGLAMALLSLGALLFARLISIPIGLAMGFLLVSGSQWVRVKEKTLTAISNVLALILLLGIGATGAEQGLLQSFVDTVPYLLISTQLYYLLRPSLEDRFFYFALTVILALVEAALVQTSSLFVIIFPMQVFLLLRGATLSEETRIQRALVAGTDVRSAKLLSWPRMRRSKTTPTQQPCLIVPGVPSSRLRRGSVFALTLALIVLLFVSLPRAQMAGSLDVVSSQQRKDEARSRIGFTDQVKHGRFDSLAEDDSVVMTVRIERSELRGESPRWRGKALNRFDGTAWTSDMLKTKYQRWHYNGFENKSVALPQQTIYPDNKEPLYFLESRSRETETRRSLVPARFRLAFKGADTVFTPPRPAIMSGFDDAALVRDFNGALTVRETLPRNVELYYQVWFEKPDTGIEAKLQKAPPYDRQMNPDFSALFLRLPANLDPRIRELGRGLAKGKKPYAALQATLDHLENEYTYSMDPATTPSGPDPLADFLFRAKTGHCEYFASAMAVLLRTQGIPTRVVAGFQHGEWNELGEFFTVRQRDAHAWVEVFFEGVGWVSFDPSPRSQENLAFQNRRGWWAKNAMPVIRYLDDVYFSNVTNFNRTSQNKMVERAADLFNRIGTPLGRGAAWLLDRPFLLIIFSLLGLVATAWWLFKNVRKRDTPPLSQVAFTAWKTRTIQWGVRGKAVAQVYHQARKRLAAHHPQSECLTAREILAGPAFFSGEGSERAMEALQLLTEMYERARFAAADFTPNELIRAKELTALVRDAAKQKA